MRLLAFINVFLAVATATFNDSYLALMQTVIGTSPKTGEARMGSNYATLFFNKWMQSWDVQNVFLPASSITIFIEVIAQVLLRFKD